MKSPSPAFSLYPKDILSDEQVKVMTLDELGAYVKLLCHAWLEGSIPRDPARLARLLGVRVSKLRKMWPAIEPCWGIAPDAQERLIQSRLERERQLQRERSAKQAEKGKRGGRPKDSTRDESHGLAAGSPEKAAALPRRSLPSPSSSSTTDLSSKQSAPNPLVDRQKLEREWYELIPLVATAEDLDPTEVSRKVSEYKGNGHVNVANMTDDRLAQSLVALRGWARRIQGKRDPGPPKPEPAHPPPREPRTVGQRAVSAFEQFAAEKGIDVRAANIAGGSGRARDVLRGGTDSDRHRLPAGGGSPDAPDVRAEDGRPRDAE